MLIRNAFQVKPPRNVTVTSVFFKFFYQALSKVFLIFFLAVLPNNTFLDRYRVQLKKNIITMDSCLRLMLLSGFSFLSDREIHDLAVKGEKM